MVTMEHRIRYHGGKMPPLFCVVRIALDRRGAAQNSVFEARDLSA
jgi:hypothetical protein